MEEEKGRGGDLSVGVSVTYNCVIESSFRCF
jgi:hypothetical protein